jgi:hypothetical protein
MQTKKPEVLGRYCKYYCTSVLRGVDKHSSEDTAYE